MLKLLKYEFRKNRTILLILFAITLLAQGALVFGIATDRNTLLEISIGILFVLAFAGVICMGIHSITTLHHDMNTRQSYMLFMTPHSAYAILGAKVLECCLSLVFAGAFYFALGFLDVNLVMNHFGQLQELWDMIQSMVRLIGQEISFQPLEIAMFCFELIGSWFSVIVTAFLADIIASALLNGKKLGGLVSFLLFIGLTIGISTVISELSIDLEFAMVYAVRGLVYTAFAVIMYIISARIMDKYLSV